MDWTGHHRVQTSTPLSLVENECTATLDGHDISVMEYNRQHRTDHNVKWGVVKSRQISTDDNKQQMNIKFAKKH